MFRPCHLLAWRKTPTCGRWHGRRSLRFAPVGVVGWALATSGCYRPPAILHRVATGGAVVPAGTSSSGGSTTGGTSLDAGGTIGGVGAPGVYTLAGNGVEGFADGSAGPNGAAEFDNPAAVAVDASGSIYVADWGNNRIRKIAGGQVTTLAGNGQRGFADGSGGPQGTASFQEPGGIAVDDSGNVYVADTGNNAVRKIDSAGNVTTVAGQRAAGYADGIGSAAQFNWPVGIAIAPGGNLVIADDANNRIRWVDPSGRVSTLAGSGRQGYLDGPGGIAEFSSPVALAEDADDNLVFVADENNDRIRAVDGAGNVTTFAGNGQPGRQDGSGGPSGSAEFWAPRGLAIAADDSLFVADNLDDSIRLIREDGDVRTIAGDGRAGYADGAFLASQFNRPSGAALDLSGNVVIADFENQRIRLVQR